MDWKQVIDQHYAVAYDPADFSLAVNSPATTAQIESLEEALGFTFPGEWHSLYKTTNGFGVVPKNDPHFASDLFPSIDTLPTFVATARETIAQTHPEDAKQYIPVLDFINGDTIGYRADSKSDRLHMLSHEAMAYESDKDIEDVLYPIASESLQAFLLP